MKAFFERYLFIFVWLLILVIVGAAATLIFQLSQFIAPSMPAITPPAPPSAPAAPSISLVIQPSESGTGKTLAVQWNALPASTTALDIFRAKTGTADWALWKTISIAPENVAHGAADISVTPEDTEGYSFYAEAIGGGGNDSGSGASGGNSTSTQEILWTSSSTIPTVAPTSTPPQTPTNTDSGSNDDGSGGGPANTTTTTSTATSTTPSQTPTSTATSTTQTQTSSSTTASSTTPSGYPYYNPQVQIEAYGEGQSGAFWVQHVNKQIQMGWQNLPSSTTNIAIFRSESADGAWSPVLTQGNLNGNGTYSIQIVDNTLGAPYYYKLNALAGTSTIATYGPVYLPPNGQ